MLYLVVLVSNSLHFIFSNRVKARKEQLSRSAVFTRTKGVMYVRIAQAIYGPLNTVKVHKMQDKKVNIIAGV